MTTYTQVTQRHETNLRGDTRHKNQGDIRQENKF